MSTGMISLIALHRMDVRITPGYEFHCACGEPITDHPAHLAEKLTAAGYSKLRTITTVEELDALPRGSVVACITHMANLPVTFVFQRGSLNGMGMGWTTPDTEGQIESTDVFEFVGLNGFPTTFTVLVEPNYGVTP